MTEPYDPELMVYRVQLAFNAPPIDFDTSEDLCDELLQINEVSEVQTHQLWLVWVDYQNLEHLAAVMGEIKRLLARYVS